MNIYELHEKMTGHLFPAYSNKNERFLALALCGEVAELMEVLDPVEGKFGSEDVDDARDELADVRVYVELLAKCFDIEGDKLTFDRGRARWRTENNSGRDAVMSLSVNAGLLANLIKKRWRDGIDEADACRSVIGATREAIEVIAWHLGIEGDKLDACVVKKLCKVIDKHKARLFQDNVKEGAK